VLVAYAKAFEFYSLAWGVFGHWNYISCNRRCLHVGEVNILHLFNW